MSGVQTMTARRFGTVAEVTRYMTDHLGAAMVEDGLVDLDHALQCAAAVKAMRPADLDLQVAGLAHDIGHDFGPDRDHARLGAEAVRGLLGERVAALVGLHVDAKRYLVATDPAYFARLSPDSVRTLALQGGGMGAAEIAAFEARPYFAEGCLLRMADEAAKVPGRQVPGLSSWVEALEGVAARAH